MDPDNHLNGYFIQPTFDRKWKGETRKGLTMIHLLWLLIPAAAIVLFIRWWRKPQQPQLRNKLIEFFELCSTMSSHQAGSWHNRPMKYEQWVKIPREGDKAKFQEALHQAEMLSFSHELKDLTISEIFKRADELMKNLKKVYELARKIQGDAKREYALEEIFTSLDHYLELLKEHADILNARWKDMSEDERYHRCNISMKMSRINERARAWFVIFGWFTEFDEDD